MQKPVIGRQHVHEIPVRRYQMMQQQPQMNPEQMKKMQEEMQKLGQENQALKQDQQTEMAKLQVKSQLDAAELQHKQQIQTQELAIDHGEIDHSEKRPSNEGIPPELPDLPRSP